MKKDIVKTVYSEVTQVIDSQTGEVIDTSIKEIDIVVNSDEFALIYAGFWNAIAAFKLQMPDVELLGKLIQHHSDGTPFTISAPLKQQLSELTGRPVNTYSNSTKRLVEHKFIVPTSKKARSYVINPRYAFKGSSANRKQALIKITQSCPDC